MTISLPIVHIWTDGACSGNPGPGGWAAVLVFGRTIKELFGGMVATTSNAMELYAIHRGLVALKVPCAVTIYTDSQNCIGWLSLGWKRKNPSIRTLCSAVEAVISEGGHDVTFEKVKAHDGVRFNERVDFLATSIIPT